jgi:hypothetical protein
MWEKIRFFALASLVRFYAFALPGECRVPNWIKLIIGPPAKFESLSTVGEAIGHCPAIKPEAGVGIYYRLVGVHNYVSGTVARLWISAGSRTSRYRGETRIQRIANAHS